MCKFDDNGVCRARVCYSSTECTAKDKESGFVNYGSTSEGVEKAKKMMCEPDACMKGQERDAEADLAWLGALVTTRSCLIAKYWINRAQALQAENDLLKTYRREDVDCHKRCILLAEQGQQLQQAKTEALAEHDRFEAQYETLFKKYSTQVVVIKRMAADKRQLRRELGETSIKLGCERDRAIKELQQAKGDNAALLEALKEIDDLTDPYTGDGISFLTEEAIGIYNSIREKALSTTGAEHAEIPGEGKS